MAGVPGPTQIGWMSESMANSSICRSRAKPGPRPITGKIYRLTGTTLAAE